MGRRQGTKKHLRRNNARASIDVVSGKREEDEDRSGYRRTPALRTDAEWRHTSGRERGSFFVTGSGTPVIRGGVRSGATLVESTVASTVDLERGTSRCGVRREGERGGEQWEKAAARPGGQFVSKGNGGKAAMDGRARRECGCHEGRAGRGSHGWKLCGRFTADLGDRVGA